MAMLMVNAFKMHSALAVKKFATCQDFIAAAAVEIISNPDRRDSHRGESQQEDDEDEDDESDSDDTDCDLQPLPPQENPSVAAPRRRCKSCHGLTRYACVSHAAANGPMPICSRPGKGCFLEHQRLVKKRRTK